MPRAPREVREPLPRSRPVGNAATGRRATFRCSPRSSPARDRSSDYETPVWRRPLLLCAPLHNRRRIPVGDINPGTWTTTRAHGRRLGAHGHRLGAHRASTRRPRPRKSRSVTAERSLGAEGAQPHCRGRRQRAARRHRPRWCRVRRRTEDAHASTQASLVTLCYRDPDAARHPIAHAADAEVVTLSAGSRIDPAWPVRRRRRRATENLVHGASGNARSAL